MTIRPASEWESGEPGFYHDPGPVYYEGDEISQSFLKKGRVSMLTAKRSLEVEDTDTEAMAFGRAIHLYFQDREAFDSQYVVAEPCKTTLGSGDRKGQPCGNPGKIRCGGVWYCGSHGKGMTPDEIASVTPQQVGWIRDWTEQLAAKEAWGARSVLDGPGSHEVAMRWIDPDTGLTCRGKWDFLHIEHGVGRGHDYKTKARYSSEISLSYEIDDRAYYWQEAFYRDGAGVLGVEIEDFAFVWLIKPEKSDPALCRIDRIDELSVALGRQEIRDMMDKVAGCRLTGYWPGLDLSQVGTISLPPRRKFDTDLVAAALESKEEYSDELPA